MTAHPGGAPAITPSRRTDQERQGDLAATLERLREGVQSLTTSEGWKAWLQFAACMPTYSVNNQLLILAQRPTASAVASYTSWKSLGRQVVRGEKGIRILAPTKRAVTDVDDEDRLASPAGGSLRSGHNAPPHRVVTGYRTVSVFDVSQTTGAPLPEPQRPSLLSGEAPPGLWEGLATQVQQAGFHLERVPSAAAIGGANGVTDFGSRTVQVRADVSPAQAAKTLAHELGHVLLHDPARGASPTGPCRDDKEVEAESVAFIVLAHAGVDTSDYSFGYVAGWATGAQPDVIRARAQRILHASRSIMAALPCDLTADPAPAVLTSPESTLDSPSAGPFRASVSLAM